MTDQSISAVTSQDIDMNIGNFVYVKWNGNAWVYCTNAGGAISGGGENQYASGNAFNDYGIKLIRLEAVHTPQGFGENTNSVSQHPNTNYYTGTGVDSTAQNFHDAHGTSPLTIDGTVFKIIIKSVSAVTSNFWDFFTVEAAIPVCYSGLSMVETKFGLKQASEVKKGDYVLSTTRGFVEVLDNIVTYSAKEYYLFKKGCFGETPTEDFYATGGHPIFLNNTEILAKDIPEGERIIVENETVYSIATSEREYIKINGLDVCTWDYNDWITNDLSKKILWDSN